MNKIEPIQEFERTGYMDYPYIDYPLFSYVNMVANNFWWEPEPDFDEEKGEQYFIKSPSFVPSRFARRYIDRQIDVSHLDKYLQAANEKPIFKHHKFSEIDDTNRHDLKKVQEENVPDISMTLKVYHLDISKFWYLCVCIKDWVEGKTCEGARISLPTHREELKNLTNELNKLNPKLFGSTIKTTGKAKLTLNVNGKNTVIEDTQTLTLLNVAVLNFLDSGICKTTIRVDGEKDEYIVHNPLLDTSELGTERLTKAKAKTIKLALFYKYLNWFLKEKEADNDIIANYPLSISINKDLLISRMAFFTGVTDNEKFLSADNSDKGFIRTAISGYEDVEIPTDNKYYGFG